ncbi:MAG: carboxypeptidase-like regulatory domain-containing protein [Acidobacteria bacterium]|nr:carboxypeptidase-like regulatory domain-containing protein [Acidobacteriota bacterium]
MRFEGNTRTWMVRIVVLLAMLAAASSLAYAQSGTTTSVNGTVVDASGAAVPGADVTVKNNATGTVYTTVTTANGTFSVPGVSPGIYSVTVALMGFKTHVVPEVPVNAGTPASVRTILEVGKIEETVVVTGGAEIVQTVNSAVSTTLNVRQITNLPLNSRDLSNFVGTMPGVDVASSVRNSNVNGLPQGQINMTIDGVNVQDNTLKLTDGFFALVSPRLDAMEEMTFSSAGAAADSSGQGAVQMRFTTRSGGNKFIGSTYFYYRNDALDQNTYFNIRDGVTKTPLTLYQPGGRLGGPILRNKLFFFVNYEEYRSPGAVDLSRTMLNPRMLQGFLQLGTAANPTEYNVWTEAARMGLPYTADPTMTKLLADMNASTTCPTCKIVLPTGSMDPQYQTIKFQQDSTVLNRFPTIRLDYNLTQNHRLSLITNSSTNSSFPDTTNHYEQQYPGFPLTMGQSSTRYQYSASLRSVFGKSLVNEARYGGSGGNVLFFDTYTKDMLTGPIANTNGFTVSIPTNAANPGAIPTKQARNAPVRSFDDTVTWIKGKHSVSFGGTWTQIDYWGWMQTLAPAISINSVPGDGFNGVFGTTTLNSTDAAKAQTLYALLIGEVSAINGNVRLDENTNAYSYLGKGYSRAQLRQLDLFAQDSWRVKPNLTVNAGVRYALEFPMSALNNSYTTATMADIWGITGVAPGFVASSVGAGPNLGYLFQPGVLNGVAGSTPGSSRVCVTASPCYQELKKGQEMFKTQYANIAPSIGFNWTPSASKGFLRRLLGESGDSSISGGYSVAFERPGVSAFTGVVGSNPGVSTTTNRNYSNGNLTDPNGVPGQTLSGMPVLFSQTSRLGPPTNPLVIPAARVYPINALISNSVNIFDPNLKIPYAQTYTVGYQRAVSKTTSVSVRYIGTRSKEGWTAYNYNERDIIDNGFLNEFKLAQANLQYNIANGKGNTFKYTGPGTSPLPIYLAFFQGLPAANATDTTKYTSSNFSSSNYYNYLALTNPNPFTAAGTGSYGLGNTTMKANGIAAGLPRNFWVVNPDVGSANVTGNGGYTKYNAMQLELRRRMSSGLQVNVSYAFGRSWGSSRYSFRVDRLPTRQTGSSGGIEHAVKANWIYELPFGRGKRFLSNASPLVNAVLGGWQWQGLGSIQSGRLIDFGNVRLVGMTAKDLQSMYKYRVDAAGKVWMLPQDVIDNTVLAFSYSATDPTGYSKGVPTGRYIAPAQSATCIESISTTYGTCGTRSLVITSPLYWNVDMSLAKQFPIRGRVVFDFRAEVFNAFNTDIFAPVQGQGVNNTSSNFEVTGTQLSGRRVQLAFRVSW